MPYPGIKEFVATFEKEFNTAPSFHAAGTYAACQLLLDAVRQAGNMDPEKLREQLLTFKTRTVLGDYAVDERGYQIGNKGLLVQWQDGKRVVVWPDDLKSARPRFPTPPWSQR